MTSNVNKALGFFFFPRICLNKFFLVSVQHFILSLLDYHHTLSQQFSHFSIVVSAKKPWHYFVCPSAPEDDQLSLMLSCWCSFDLLMILFFVLPPYTGPHEHFNSYTSALLLLIKLSLFLHKYFLNLGPLETLLQNFCISFFIFALIFRIQDKVIVFFLSVLLLSLLLILRVFFSKLSIIFVMLFDNIHFHKTCQSDILYFPSDIFQNRS